MKPTISLTEAIDAIAQFHGHSLKHHIAEIEDSLAKAGPAECQALALQHGISPELLRSGIIVKQAAAQIDVVLHAVGIVISLPHLLRTGEVIESLSLGAGATGKPFDLETNLRVAEFKFIDWKGGSESIRQNSLFKDFYLLAEADTLKERYLYVIDASRPLRFLNGRRAIASILSHESKLWAHFQKCYGDRFSVVGEYYEYRKELVKIVALGEVLPELWAALERPNTGDVR